MTTQVSDFLYKYRDQDIDGIQQYISGKYEFAQLSSDTREPIPSRGKRFKHQELILRFMKIYDKVLLIHDTGTGKTCTTLAAAQSFKNEWLNGAIEYANTYINGQPGNINKVVVFTKSDTLENEFRQQLVCKCTEYEEYEAKLEKTKQGRGSKRALSGRLKNFFTFEHYRSFTNRMSKNNINNLDEVIRNQYENTLFILDEVQDLITDDDREDKYVKDENKSAFDMLHRVLHVCKNIKVMLASATPMIDQNTEIIPVMNLILPLDMQLSFDMNLDTMSIDDLEPYFRGRVSYVRALDTGAIPTYVGDPLDTVYNIKVFKSQMDSETAHGRKAIELERTKDSYRSKARQAGLFTFPDGSIGEDGMNKYFKQVGKSYSWNYDNVSAVSMSQELSIENGKYNDPNAIDEFIDKVYKYSPKYYTALKLLEQYNDGSHFMYFNFVRVGTTMFSILLDLMGYTLYDPSTSAFNKIQMGGKLKYCSDETSDIRTNLEPAKRYAIITSQTKRPDLILELMNSPINRYGEYIKVLLVSEVAKTGINVSNIKYGHLIDPAWNQSTAYQALSRFIRSTSHVDLIKDVAEKEHIDISDVRIPILIFQHCLTWGNGVNDTIDESLYKKCVDKDRGIRRIFRILKQCAFDCQIHRKRNIRSTDEDYSPVCDYDKCDYPCYDNDPESMDYTSYNTIYSGDEVARIEHEIGNVFRTTSFIKYSELIIHLMGVFGHDEFEIKMLTDRAVRHIVEERKILRDKYNFVCYLREDKDDLFIQREYPSGVNDSSLSLYSNRLIAVKSRSIDTIMKETLSILTPEIINDITRLGTSSKSYEDRLYDVLTYCIALNIDVQISLLEHYLVKYGIDEDQSDPTTLVIRSYYLNIFWFQEPIAELESQRLSTDKEKLYNASISNKPLSKKKVVATNYQQYGDLVYLHNLNPTTGVLYAETAASRTGDKLRILTSYEKTFRDVDPFEFNIYSTEIANQRQMRKEKFSEYPIFGSYSIRTQMFRLVLNYLNTNDTADKRNKFRGTRCNNISNRKIVVNLAADLGINIPITQNVNITDKIKYLTEAGYDTFGKTYPVIDRMYELASNTKEYHTKEICDLILDDMLDKNMIYYES